MRPPFRNSQSFFWTMPSNTLQMELKSGFGLSIWLTQYELHFRIMGAELLARIVLASSRDSSVGKTSVRARAAVADLASQLPKQLWTLRVDPSSAPVFWDPARHSS